MHCPYCDCSVDLTKDDQRAAGACSVCTPVIKAFKILGTKSVEKLLKANRPQWEGWSHQVKGFDYVNR